MDLLEFFVLVNRFLFMRLRGFAFCGVVDFVFDGLTGVFARSLGFLLDARFFSSYDCFFLCFGDFIFGFCGDCLDRFLCRFLDMRLSLYFLAQFLFRLFGPLFFLGDSVIEQVIAVI